MAEEISIGLSGGTFEGRDEKLMWRSPTEIVLETGQPSEIAFWLSQGVVGVTTNPSIILAVGHYELRVAAHALATLLDGGPMSVEVASDAPGEMVARGRDLAAIAPNNRRKDPRSRPPKVGRV